MVKKILLVAIIILALLALYNNLFWFMRYIYPLKYEKSIIKHSLEFQVDPYLVTSVIKVESNFSPNVISKQGAIGLMQLMPKTALWVAEQMGMDNINAENLQNPDLNIKIGTWYLSSLLTEFDQDTILALAAYNGGRGNVARWLEKGYFKQRKAAGIPFSETRNFVAKVKKSYKWA